METLQEVQDYLDNIEFINNGGCAIAALAMYRWLKKQGLIDDSFKFVYLYDSEKAYKKNSEVLSGNSNEPSSCAHCCILYDNKYIDSGGYVTTGMYTYIHHISEEQFMVHSINSPYWNTWFDRDNVGIIAYDLDIDLDDINTKLEMKTAIGY